MLYALQRIEKCFGGKIINLVLCMIWLLLQAHVPLLWYPFNQTTTWAYSLTKKEKIERRRKEERLEIASSYFMYVCVLHHNGHCLFVSHLIASHSCGTPKRYGTWTVMTSFSCRLSVLIELLESVTTPPFDSTASFTCQPRVWMHLEWI